METHETHAEVASAGGGQNPLLRLDPGMAIWTWIVFFLVLFVLYRFAWKPILRLLEEREARIRKSLEDAEEARRLLEETINRQKDVLEQAHGEAIDIIQKARESAQNVAMEIEKRAMHEAERTIEGAKNAIENERERAVKELRKEAASLAVTAAGRLIRENLDDERNRKLVDAYIREVSG